MRAHPASLFEISTQEWGCEPGLGLCPPCWNVELLLMVEVAGVGAAPMAPRQHPSHQAPWLCLQPLPQSCLHPHPQLVCGKAATSILQLLGAGKSPEGVPAPGTACVMLLLCLSWAQPHQSPRSGPDLLLQYRCHSVQSHPGWALSQAVSGKHLLRALQIFPVRSYFWGLTKWRNATGESLSEELEQGMGAVPSCFEQHPREGR